MTEKTVRELVVEAAKDYLGCREGDGSHKKIIDLYNSQKSLPRGYQVGYRDAWCAAFVSAVGVRLGMEEILLPECSCNRMIALYKSRNRWEEKDTYVPQPGDLVMYDWEDTGNGDNRGQADHVGMIVEADGDSLRVIEGNLGNAVAYRTIEVNGKQIRGYCLPEYSRCAGRVDGVQKVQWWLNLQFDARLDVDGVYGSITRKALVRALQKTLGVAVDGIYGPKTAKAVEKNLLYPGSRGMLVQILQGFLVCNGYKNAYADGIFGAGTKEALMAYQRKKGLAADGIAGPATFQKLSA